jgi:hypothetical protein
MGSLGSSHSLARIVSLVHSLALIVNVTHSLALIVSLVHSLALIVTVIHSLAPWGHSRVVSLSCTNRHGVNRVVSFSCTNRFSRSLSRINCHCHSLSCTNRFSRSLSRINRHCHSLSCTNRHGVTRASSHFFTPTAKSPYHHITQQRTPIKTKRTNKTHS